jgi:uncharacterized protein YegL/serine/threonine protein kinase
MSLTDKIEINRRTLPVVFIIGTSGSMAGSKIGAVNSAMEKILPTLKEISDEHPDYKIKVAVLEFSSVPRWDTNGLVELDKYRWNDLEASGIADFGKACKEIDEKLSPQAFLLKEPGSYITPFIILISDGIYFDDWRSCLNKLKSNNWFKQAEKIVFAIGDDANMNVLKEFTGTAETVSKGFNVALFKKFINSIFSMDLDRLPEDRIELPRRTLPLFFIIGTSASMAGEKIGAVNVFIQEIIPMFKVISDENADAQIKVAVMEFSTGARWVTDGLIELNQFRWNDLDAEGAADFGAACKELDEKLSRNGFIKDANRYFAPIIILLSDSVPTDDWQGSLQKLKGNDWYKMAIRIAYTIGCDADKDILKEFTGTMETVLETHNATMLKKMIKLVDADNYFDWGQYHRDEEAKEESGVYLQGNEYVISEAIVENIQDEHSEDIDDDWDWDDAEIQKQNTMVLNTEINEGFTIKTKGNKTVRVLKKLGEGAQGVVYKVDYDGQTKALKWYSAKRLNSPDKFYNDIENYIKIGKPSKAFLWPEDITEKRGDAFGYIMELRPPEYKDFSRFLIGKEDFASVTAMVNTSLNIVARFHELHNKGCICQSLNDGNFLINPKTGNVLMCDFEDFFEADKDSFIMGKTRYMAPEIVLRQVKPNRQTDLFTLSVILFLLWNRNHPLEGKNTISQCMTAAEEKRIYGNSPVFIFDTIDDSNRPVPGLHKGAIANWPLLPKYLQDEFITAFNKEVLSDTDKRIIEQDWLRLFIKMRGEIYKCSCGEVYFADPITPNPCPNCKKTNTFSLYIKTSHYNLAVHQRTKLYACHTENGSDDFETLIGEVAAVGNEYRLKNVSGKNWTITDGDNTNTLVPSADVELKNGLKIDFGAGNAEVLENKEK